MGTRDPIVFADFSGGEGAREEAEERRVRGGGQEEEGRGAKKRG